MVIDSALIAVLADGQFHSGEQLGQQLGVSRAAIHNHIEKLTALGLDIFRVTGKGYKLAKPLQLLNGEEIQRYLGEHASAPVYLHHVTGSTNDDIKALAASKGELPAGTCVLAEMQTQGRGRRGKAWFSPFGANLYVSIYWPLQQGLSAAMGLSVAIGLSLAEMLKNAGIADVSVKWPNDVYIQRQKVAGILVELEGQAGGEGQAIVGIGLNLSLPTQHSAITQPYTSIDQHVAGEVSRNWWAAALIRSSLAGLQRYESEGLKPQLALWQQFDHFYQQPVTLLLGQHQQQGIGLGIDEHGAFLVQQHEGIKRYFGGEISVRNATD